MDIFEIAGAEPDNMGGLGMYLRIALHEDIQSFPPTAPDPEGATAELVADYTGDFTMKSGKYFKEFKMTYDMSGFDAAGQGETDGMSFRQTLPAKFAGASAAVRAFLHSHRHSDFVLILQDKQKKLFVMGDEVNPVKIDPASRFGLGNGAAEKRGADVTFFCNSNNPLAGFSGTIPLAPSGSGSASAS